MNYFKTILLTLLLTTLSTLPATAYDFCVNGIFYGINGNEATVTYKTSGYNSYSGEVIIPSTVTYGGSTYTVSSIGDHAFQGCSGLTNVAIPKSVTSIGNYAFRNCTAITSVICRAMTPPTMNDINTFSDYSTPTLYVPEQSLALYQSTDYWNQFTTIVPIDNSMHQDRFYIEDFEMTPGESRTVSILLDNETSYTAFQTDIYLPAGLNVVQEDGDYIFDLTTRKARDHNIASQVQPNGSIRVMSYSPSIKTYSGNSGALVTFDITASEDFTGPATIALCGTLFTTAAGMEVTFNDEMCTVNTSSTVMRGDVNGDGNINMDDLTALINYLVFANAPINIAGAASCSSADDTTIVNMDDLTALINYLVYNQLP